MKNTSKYIYSFEMPFCLSFDIPRHHRNEREIMRTTATTVPQIIACAVGIAAVGAAFVLFSAALDLAIPSKKFASSNVSVATAAEAPRLSNWVTTQRLDRHSCPSSSCGVVGEYFYREGVENLEERDGFIRVSKYYDASCADGRSEYVDRGPADCIASNGIEDGQFAEWVAASALSTVRPADPSEGAEGLAALVGSSDDFNLYQAEFVRAAQTMIDQSICSHDLLARSGGFWASINLRPRKAYWLICGNARVYLDVETGEIWKQ